MVNPENESPIKRADAAIGYKITNHKSLGLPILKKIAECCMSLNNLEIFTIKDGEEIALLSKQLRETRKRTMSFGVPDKVFIGDIALNMLRAENIIIKATLDLAYTNS
jgi:hypothetical protein